MPVALVHEQVDSVRNLVSQTLTQEGYRVLEAATLPAAIEMFDCWLADINLVVSGAQSNVEANELLSRLRSRLPDVPAILLLRSGHTCESFHDVRTRAVTRPFDSDDLTSALHEIERRDCAVPDMICA